MMDAKGIIVIGGVLAMAYAGISMIGGTQNLQSFASGLSDSAKEFKFKLGMEQYRGIQSQMIGATQEAIGNLKIPTLDFSPSASEGFTRTYIPQTGTEIMTSVGGMTLTPQAYGQKAKDVIVGGWQGFLKPSIEKSWMQKWGW